MGYKNAGYLHTTRVVPTSWATTNVLDSYGNVSGHLCIHSRARRLWLHLILHLFWPEWPCN